MKFFYATLSTETNTFSPIPTGYNAWRAGTLVRKSDDGASTRRVRDAIRPLVEWGAARGLQIDVGLLANAEPGGITPRRVYEELRNELIADLKASMPVDGIVLQPHGAMIAEDYDDCAGDLLGRVRAVVGPGVPVGAVLDPHCHLTAAMVAATPLLVGFKEYPHVDAIERILQVFDLVGRTAEGRIRPTIARFDCRMISVYPTTAEPMSSVVRAMKELERQPGALNLWLCHGFPFADVPTIGTQAVAITDGDSHQAARLAEHIGRMVYALREKLRPNYLSLDDSLTLALNAERGPVTIADCADNPGGGAPGDSTFFLHTIINRQIENVALGPLYDPHAVAICHDAGVGARLKLRLGGKLGSLSGDPVDATCTVTAVASNVYQNYAGLRFSLGDCAAVKIAVGGGPTGTDDVGIDVVLSEKREQARSPEFFTALNVDVAAKRILVVKSTTHFQLGFAPISAKVLHASGPGALQADITEIPYTRVATQNFWPFVNDPLADQAARG